MNDLPDNEFEIPDEWIWLARLHEKLKLDLANVIKPVIPNPKTVKIECIQGVCVVDPEDITVDDSNGQRLWFEAIGTKAHVFNPNDDLSPVAHLEIPAGQKRVFPISPGAEKYKPYPYIVYCEGCGLNCPGPGPDTPKMIVQ